MRSFRFDPYLWVHLTGIAAVPIFLELCLVGLAIGEPLFPLWFELLFVGGIGILPILWMQWQRPFSIFSLLMLALKPAQLTDDQRRILFLFKTPISRILSLLTAIFMGWVLWQLYKVAPSIAPAVDWLPTARGAGLVIAAVAFLGSNLFVQVPVSVLRVLLSSTKQFAAIDPYPVNQVAKDFTVAGIRVAKILPPLVAATPTAGSPASPAPVAPPTSAPTQEPIAPQSVGSTAVPDILEEEWEEGEEEAIDSAVEVVVREVELSEQPIGEAQAAEAIEPEAIEPEAIELAESESIPDDLGEEADTADGDVLDVIAMAQAGLGLQPVEDEQFAENEPPTEVEQVTEVELVAEVVNELADGTPVETIAIEAEIVSDQPLNVLEEIVDLTEEILIPEGFTVEKVSIEAERVESHEAQDLAFTDLMVKSDEQPTGVAIAETDSSNVETVSVDAEQLDSRQPIASPEITIIEDETVVESYSDDNSSQHE